MARFGPWLAAGVSGAGIAAAFSPLAAAPVAWVALVPLMAVLARATPGRAAALGWVAGTTAYLGILGWLPEMLRQFGGLGDGRVLAVYVGVAGALGVPTALWAALVRWLGRRGWPLLACAPPAWAVTEWVRGAGPLGFPWTPLGTSQVAWLPVVQLAEVTGVAGLSALVVLGNVVLTPPVRWRPLVAAGALVALVVTGGAWRVRQIEASERAGRLAVGMVQGHVAQSQKWNPAYGDEILARHVALSQLAARTGVDLLVWAETATPFYFQEPGARRAAIERLVGSVSTPLLLGSPAVEPDGQRGLRRFNRAYLLAADGVVVGHYDKRVLVPFGEYVPLPWLRGILEPVIAVPGGMSPGEDAPVFPVGAATLGVTICYEHLHPHLNRTLVREGATVLINLANDAWFAGSAGAAQSALPGILRAIEHRVPVVRVANSGLSMVVEPTGRVVWAETAYQPRWHRATVWWGPARGAYSRLGDTFLLLCGCLIGTMVLWPGRTSRQTSRQR